MQNIEPGEEKYVENIIFRVKTEDIRQNAKVKYLPAIQDRINLQKCGNKKFKTSKFRIYGLALLC